MSQTSRILAYLKKGNSITPLDGLKLFGTLRLSGRIHDLKRAGIPIGKEMVNDRLNGKRYARYWLAKGKAA